MKKSIWFDLRKSLPDIITTLVIITVVFFLPRISLSFDVSTTLTVVSLLFAIMVGFFFAGASNNYFQLQSLISTEDATLITIYNLTKLIRPDKAKTIADFIDHYVIATLDYEFLDYAPKVRLELQNLVDEIDKIKPTDDLGMNIIQSLHDAKTSLFGLNEQIAIATQHIVSSAHWGLIVLQAIIVSTLLLTLRTDSLIVLLVISTIIFIIYRSLKLVYLVDNNSFLADQLTYESVQYIFESIGKLKYYPEKAFVIYEDLNPKKPYRLGIYKKSGSLEKEIKVIKR